jgi:hypothetical protein
MSSFFKSISNLPSSLVKTMSTSWFSRVWGTAPAKIEPASAALTPEQQAEDRAAFEKALTDAVAAAIKNDEFTQAVATNLASQLQPSLKAALDISSVETKLLAANDQLAKQVGEADAQTTTKLAELSSLIDASSTTAAGKVSAIEAAVAQITLSLSELGNNVKALQEQVASPDTTLLSQHSSKLDNLATDLKSVQAQIASPDASLLSSHSTKLDNIATDLVAIKASPETAAALKTITSELASIKADIKNDDSSVKILQGLQASNDAHTSHTATLADIKSNDSSAKILEVLQTSNDAHAAHAATLAEIKAANEAAEPTLAGINTQVGTVLTTLSAIQSADVSGEILSATRASNESHAAHSAALSELKAAATAPAQVSEPTDISGLETSVKSIITTLGAQGSTLEEIKAATSAPAAVAEKTDLAPLETSVKTIITTLDSQGSTLQEIKAAASAPAAVAEKTDLAPLETSVKTIITTLDSQTATLTEIKSASSTTELLAAIHGQDAVLAEIKTASASTEVLAAIHSQDTVLAEIKSASSTTEITTSIQSVKSDISTSTDAMIAKVDALHTAVSSLPAPAAPAAVETPNGKVEDHEVKGEAAEVAAEA